MLGLLNCLKPVYITPQASSRVQQVNIGCTYDATYMGSVLNKCKCMRSPVHDSELASCQHTASTGGSCVYASMAEVQFAEQESGMRDVT